MKNGAIGKLKFESIQKELLKCKYPTKFNFLKSHNGARGAELSTILSPNGSGKSTLVRSIIVEMLTASKKVYTYLSEETIEKYILSIYRYFLVATCGNYEITDGAMKNLFLESAFEGKKFSRTDDLIESIKNAILTEMIDAIFIDNFTAIS